MLEQLAHDLAAEKAILGAVLVTNDRLADIREAVKAPDFYRHAHKTLFEGMCRLDDRNEPIDPLTLKGALGPKGLEDVGGLAYIIGLAEGVPSGGQIEAYCRLIVQNAIRRRLSAFADKLRAEAQNQEKDAQAVANAAQEALYAISERADRGSWKSSQTLTDETFALIEKIHDAGKPLRGVPTGFDELDEKLRGLQPGCLYLLAARPAMGKTALMGNIAHNVGAADTTVGVISLEMTSHELYLRQFAAVARINSQRLVSGKANDAELGAISLARGELAATSIYVDDTSSMSLATIRGKARRLKARKGLGLLILDYLQLMDSDRQHKDRYVEVGEMSRGLKQLAKELDIPIVALSQLSRALETRTDKRPMLSDLRESGSLEQDADGVLFIHRPIVYDPSADPTEAEIIIGKNRGGPTGTVKVKWSAEHTRFDNLHQRI